MRDNRYMFVDSYSGLLGGRDWNCVVLKHGHALFLGLWHSLCGLDVDALFI